MLKKHDRMVIVFHNREIYKWMEFGLICVQSWTTVFQPSEMPLLDFPYYVVALTVSRIPYARIFSWTGE